MLSILNQILTTILYFSIDTAQSQQQIKTSKVSEYKNPEIKNNDQSKKSVVVDDVDDDGMDNIDSDDEGHGVPITK